MPRFKVRAWLFLALTLFLVRSPAAIAQSTWTGAINNSWTNSGNWINGVPGSGETAQFNGTGNGNTTITLGGATQPINTIQFASGAAVYTIGQSPGDAVAFDTNGLIDVATGVTNAQTFNAKVSTNGDLLVINGVANGATTGDGLVGLTLGAIDINGILNITQGAASVTTLLNGTISDAQSQVGFLHLTAPTAGASNNSNFVINGNNTYTGGTNIQANTGTNGAIYVGTNSAFGTGKINIIDSGFNAEIRALGGNRSISNPVDLNRGVVFAGANDVVLNGTITVSSSTSRTIFSKIGGTKNLVLGESPGSSTIYLGNLDTNFASTIILSAITIPGGGGAGNMIINALFQDVDPNSANSAVTYSGNAPGRIIINATQTYASPTKNGGGQVTLQFKHDTVLSGSTIVSGPFGVGTFVCNGANNAQLVPTEGDRTIANPIRMEFGFTVDNLKDSGGATLDSSGVTFTGPIEFVSSAGRLIQNKMNRTSGGTLTLGSADSPSTVSLVMGPTGTARTLSFDNQGRTVINDTIQDVADPNNPANTRPVDLVINSSTSTTTFNGPQNTNGNFTVNGSATAQPLAIVNGNRTGSGTMSTSGTLVINGTKSGGAAVTVNSTGTLAGTGSIEGPVTNNGKIAPGSETLIPGTLTLTGNLTNGENSHWLIGLDGTSAGKLAVGGNLDLLATDSLDIVGTGSGSSWVIATYAGTLSGTFDSVTAGYSVEYGTGSNSQITLNLLPAGLPGDFNSDGKVDAGDYVTWRKNDGTNNALANDSGLGTPIGQPHYNLWRANFGNPPGSGSGSALGDPSAVPEPAAILLVLIGIVTLPAASARRRRAKFCSGFGALFTSRSDCNLQ
jgi:hypothetical protein